MADQQLITQPVNLDDFINKDILELAGAQNMPEDEKRNIYTKMLETIQQRVMARIDDQFSDEDRQEWLGLLDQKDHAKMNEFLHQRGINVDQLMLQEAMIYKMELVELAKGLVGGKASVLQ